ncbi:hypothetical protein QFZ75_002548 [Streptomyces sp. V3I8]|jgi:hypothetical protein|nr:hypothetical protein [Streptomyces sp. V3I8]
MTAATPRADVDDVDDVETVRHAADGARVLEEAC